MFQFGEEKSMCIKIILNVNIEKNCIYIIMLKMKNTATS